MVGTLHTTGPGQTEVGVNLEKKGGKWFSIAIVQIVQPTYLAVFIIPMLNNKKLYKFIKVLVIWCWNNQWSKKITKV